MDAWRETLVAVSGLTPQLITETLFYLTQKRAPPVAIAEIYVLTTRCGEQRLQTSLLSPVDGCFYAFCREYGLDPATITFDARHIHVFTDAAGTPLDDIRTAADSTTVADQIVALIRRLTDDPSTRLHCSLAGGRKTQSALLGFALQLYGRPQDTLLHVLVDDAFENHSDFFYPSRRSRLIQARDGRQLDAHTARVEVAEIPYVRLRDKLFTSLPQLTTAFAPTIERLQHTLDLLPNIPPLIIDPAARKVCIGAIQIPLEPVEIVLYSQLALARIRQEGRGDGFLSLKELNGRRPEMLLRYERLYGAYSGHVENLRQAWKKGIDPARLRSHFSKITRKIRQAASGHIDVALYEVTSQPRYGATRYGLRLLPERIQVHEA